MIPSQISFNTLPVNATYASETTVDTQKFSDILYSAGYSLKDLAYLSRCLASIHPTIAKTFMKQKISAIKNYCILIAVVQMKSR